MMGIGHWWVEMVGDIVIYEGEIVINFTFFVMGRCSSSSSSGMRL